MDEQIAYPINHVTIECRQDTQRCEYRQIALILPNENSFAQSYSVTEIADESLSGSYAGKTSASTLFQVDDTKCRSTQLSLNFITQEFFEIARNNSEGDCETNLGVSLPAP